MLMGTMYIADGPRVTWMSVEELVETFQQISMEKMYVIAIIMHTAMQECMNHPNLPNLAISYVVLVGCSLVPCPSGGSCTLLIQQFKVFNNSNCFLYYTITV